MHIQNFPSRISKPFFHCPEFGEHFLWTNEFSHS